MGRAQEHETEICQIQEYEVIVIPGGDISCAIYVVSFLEGLRALPGMVPLLCRVSRPTIYPHNYF